MNLMNQENFFIDLNLLVAITLKQQIKKYGKRETLSGYVILKNPRIFLSLFYRTHWRLNGNIWNDWYFESWNFLLIQLREGCHIPTQIWQVKMLILRLTNMRVIWQLRTILRQTSPIQTYRENLIKSLGRWKNEYKLTSFQPSISQPSHL